MSKITADIAETAIVVARRYHGNPTASSALALMIGEALGKDRARCVEQASSRDKQIFEALTECAEYFSQRSDADCDQDGFIPNEEMKLLTLVDAAIKLIPKPAI